jgi:hypothetical protein
VQLSEGTDMPGHVASIGQYSAAPTTTGKNSQHAVPGHSQVVQPRDPTPWMHARLGLLKAVSLLIICTHYNVSFGCPLNRDVAVGGL